MPADRVHLVRHGEVHNPDHLVYATLDGFGLSERGRRQAAATANELSPLPIRSVVTSPLQRAVETADAIATASGVEVAVDERLIEWRLADRWAGMPWASLPDDRPGELEAYLEHPDELAFSSESLAVMADRVAGAVGNHAARAGGDLVVVSHQDPIQAALRLLTGIGFADFHDAKPRHATAITLAPAPSAWVRTSEFTPEQATPFPPVDGSH